MSELHTLPPYEHHEPLIRDAVANAVAAARAAYPDSLPIDERRNGRNHFLQRNKWSLFDGNRDGYLEFNEYLDAEWAGYLAQAPIGATTVSRQDFMTRFLGDQAVLTSNWHVPFIVKSTEALYESIDKTKKGYITKDDIQAQAKASFDFADRDHNGKLSSVEFR